MPPRAKPGSLVNQIRGMLKAAGSAQHAAGVQWFFKEEIKSHGWYTADLRKAARQTRRDILAGYDLKFLIATADQLFSGNVLEEKIFAVFLLEKLTRTFGHAEFRRFESWLPRVSSWADHDALVQYLIGPMMVEQPARVEAIFQWAKSRDRWHRRASCVALIQGTRRGMFFPEIVRLANLLLRDGDDMVQKGLGWLLRETAKADGKRTFQYLMNIRDHAPSLVLRTACETLARGAKKKILRPV